MLGSENVHPVPTANCRLPTALILRYLGENAICSSSTCWRWVNLLGFRKGIGGEEFAFDVESRLPLLEWELEIGGSDRLDGSRSRDSAHGVESRFSAAPRGLTPMGCTSVDIGVSPLGRGISAGTYTRLAIAIASGRGQRWLKRLTTPVVDVRWFGEALVWGCVGALSTSIMRVQRTSGKGPT